MRKIFSILRFIFENAPNVGFWILIVLNIQIWWQSQNNVLKLILLLIIPISGSLVIVKYYKKIKSRTIRVKAEEAVKPKTSSNDNKNLEEELKANIPSKSNLYSIYKYGRFYSKQWSDDGELVDISFYIDTNYSKTTISIQIYMYSNIRNETLITRLPSNVNKIIDGKPIEIQRKSSPAIYSFPNWKEALEKVIANSSSDIHKSTHTRLQIAPSEDSLMINMYYEKDQREWICRYTLKENQLFKNDNLFFTFK